MDDTGGTDLVFRAVRPASPHLEIRINFGVFAGRAVTPAEIDRLADSLLVEVESVAILAEDRHEFGPGFEGSVHQVRIEIDDAGLPGGHDARRGVAARCMERSRRWAQACISERHLEL